MTYTRKTACWICAQLDRLFGCSVLLLPAAELAVLKSREEQEELRHKTVENTIETASKELQEKVADIKMKAEDLSNTAVSALASLARELHNR